MHTKTVPADGPQYRDADDAFGPAPHPSAPVVRAMDPTPLTPDGLMRCAAADEVRKLSRAMTDLASQIGAFLKEHAVDRGCKCDFCRGCPWIKDHLSYVVTSLDHHSLILDCMRPMTVADWEQLRALEL